MLYSTELAWITAQKRSALAAQHHLRWTSTRARVGAQQMMGWHSTCSMRPAAGRTAHGRECVHRHTHSSRLRPASSHRCVLIGRVTIVWSCLVAHLTAVQPLCVSQTHLCQTAPQQQTRGWRAVVQPAHAASPPWRAPRRPKQWTLAVGACRTMQRVPLHSSPPRRETSRRQQSTMPAPVPVRQLALASLLRKSVRRGYGTTRGGFWRASPRCDLSSSGRRRRWSAWSADVPTSGRSLVCLAAARCRLSCGTLPDCSLIAVHAKGDAAQHHVRCTCVACNDKS